MMMAGKPSSSHQIGIMGILTFFPFIGVLSEPSDKYATEAADGGHLTLTRHFLRTNKRAKMPAQTLVQLI